MSRHCTQGCRSGSRVLDTRETLSTVIRRRVCRSCGHRWTTWEVVENSAVLLEDVKDRLRSIQQSAAQMSNHARYTVELIKGDRKIHLRGKPNGAQKAP